MSALGSLLFRGLLVIAALFSYTKAAHAVGTYTFCSTWTYSFTDQTYEDVLRHASGQNTGTYPTAYAWQSIKYNGTFVRPAAYLPQSGCASVPAKAGSYTVAFQPSMKRSQTSILIYANDNSALATYSVTLNLPGLASGVQAINLYSAQFSVTNVAAVSALALTQKSEAITAGVTHRIYALQSCLPNDSLSSCASGSSMWLGSGDASRKFVIGHELGHMLQISMWGSLLGDYSASRNPAVSLCTCDRVVDPGARSHCLQSLEFSAAAQQEGVAHFIAADLFNDKDHNDGYFTYYKEFTVSENPVNTLSPPLWLSVYDSSAGWRWMDQVCPTANGGTELDWLSFYYELNNKTSNSYSYADLKSVYREACGGANCSNTNVTWEMVRSGARSTFGTGSVKTQYLETQMAKHGVDSSGI
jgi:hypothetical protein